MESASGTVHKPMLAQTKEKYRALGANDMRVIATDVMSLKSLEEKYGKELAAADVVMSTKKENQHYFGYDYDDDWRYNQWLADKDAMKKKLQIHWVDDFLDSPTTQLTYLLRIGTTIGIVHGVGRSAYLFRTIDRAYAKLHGASFSKIAGFEICLSIVKGAACAFSGVCGIAVGESFSRLATVFVNKDVVAPERRWTHVVCASTICGLFSGGAFGFLHRQTLSRKGIAGVTSLFVAVGSGGGYFVGKKIYEPFALLRKGRIDDPHWRPWNERRMVTDGGRQVRGRYR